MTEVAARPLLMNVFSNIHRPRLILHPLWFSLIAALVLTLSLSSPFVQQLQLKIPEQYGLQTSLLTLLFLLNWLLVLLFSYPFSQKPMWLLLFVSGALSHYFISHFGIVIDKEMLQNAAEIKIYEPVDYKAKPKQYCGIEINDNPYFDA